MMSTPRALRAWLLAAVGWAVLLGANAAARAQSDTAALDQIITDAMREQRVPAITVAIAKGDQLVYSKAFGTADLENSVPATTETLIRTASIAKPITAVAAMTLVESGKLDLDAPVQKYCAPFPPKQ